MSWYNGTCSKDHLSWDTTLVFKTALSRHWAHISLLIYLRWKTTCCILYMIPLLKFYVWVLYGTFSLRKYRNGWQCVGFSILNGNVLSIERNVWVRTCVWEDQVYGLVVHGTPIDCICIVVPHGDSGWTATGISHTIWFLVLHVAGYHILEK